MATLTSAQIRQKYLDFFAQKQHDIVPSASLIPVNDPTLLWINAGVAPLKKYFDGSEVPNNPRIANSQKCIRTNDIENVGVTARHHTLFEMLGNWSIGDYFKEDVIAWAWEFLTDKKWLGFDPNRIYATYYPEDTETPEIWKKQPNFNSNHLVALEDNFWDIGVGPCGPCTEIFYDRGLEFLNIAEDDPENYPGGENERYLEVWNLVFSEFNHMPDGSYQPLPRKNIDTGMGLERVTSVIQGTATNFETDLFLPIIHRLETMTSSIKYSQSPQTDTSFKVIADHIRAVIFAIGDGALPSNEGRGYILRRLIRRSVVHGQKLGITNLFLSDLVNVVVEIMAHFYPEIQEKQEFIQKVLQAEETKFHETLHDGETLLNQAFDVMRKENRTVLDGSLAFELYDTYGFPMELTQEYATENGFEVAVDVFDKLMNEQRERARAARHKDESMTVQTDLLTKVTAQSEFIGYTEQMVTAKMIVAIQNENVTTNVLENTKATIFFDVTPFYAEMGGQVADTGLIFDLSNEIVAYVEDVKKAPNGQAMHIVKTVKPLVVGQMYQLQVDSIRRNKIIKNHTATHLLHQALKDVLGEHASQAGSYVTDSALRFDFTHFGQVTHDELKQMERIVNEKIWESLPVITIETSLDEAKKMGARALFDSKYGDVVRVVNIGGYSVELCGGIHASNTQDIGLFKIVSESGIGAGTRRIEALTSQHAYECLAQIEEKFNRSVELLKTRPNDVLMRIEQLQNDYKALQHQVDSLKAKALKQESTSLFNQVETIKNVRAIVVNSPNKDMADLREIVDTWKQGDYSDILVVASAKNGKVSLVVTTNKVANNNGIKANELIKQIAPLVNGGGGGRFDMAQAGGKNPEGITSALNKAKEILTQ